MYTLSEINIHNLIWKKLIIFLYYSKLIVNISYKNLSLKNVIIKLQKQMTLKCILLIIFNDNIQHIINMATIHNTIYNLTIKIINLNKIKKKILKTLNLLKNSKSDVSNIINHFQQNYNKNNIDQNNLRYGINLLCNQFLIFGMQ